ncbi:MAG: hypothetical protein LBU66_08950 [Treponema sp.]|jgi:hypothetical protein|nr:hypothetical protein [Treponema sp.]
MKRWKQFIFTGITPAISILAIAALTIGALFMVSCFSDEKEEQGGITITLDDGREGSARSVIPWFADDDSVLSDVRFEVILTGPGGKILLKAKNGESVYAAVAAGLWTVKIDAFYAGKLTGRVRTYYATGSNTVEVKAGRNSSVNISMNPVCQDCGNYPCDCQDCPDCGNNPCDCVMDCPDCGNTPCVCNCDHVYSKRITATDKLKDKATCIMFATYWMSCKHCDTISGNTTIYFRSEELAFHTPNGDKDADCTISNTCSVCLTYNFEDAEDDHVSNNAQNDNCALPNTCTECPYEFDPPISHTVTATCLTPGNCEICQKDVLDPDIHDADCPDTYMITGSGSEFTAVRTEGCKAVISSNNTIQNVINAIRADTTKASCAIQFGDGETELDIGDSSVNFNNTGGSWLMPGFVDNYIILKGKITSAITASASGTIYVDLTNRTRITVSGKGTKITNTGDRGSAIRNQGNAQITITDNAVVESTQPGTSLVNPLAIMNYAGGAIRIENTAKVIRSNAVNTTYGYTVENYGDGSISISGRIEGPNGVDNMGTRTEGTVFVYEGGVISTTRDSWNVRTAINNDGAIYIYSGSSISGPYGIYSYGGTVSIEGGVISTTSTAITQANFGTTTITNGTISSSGTTIRNVVQNGGRIFIGGTSTGATSQDYNPTIITTSETDSAVVCGFNQFSNTGIITIYRGTIEAVAPNRAVSRTYGTVTIHQPPTILTAGENTGRVDTTTGEITWIPTSP